MQILTHRNVPWFLAMLALVGIVVFAGALAPSAEAFGAAVNTPVDEVIVLKLGPCAGACTAALQFVNSKKTATDVDVDRVDAARVKVSFDRENLTTHVHTTWTKDVRCPGGKLQIASNIPSKGIGAIVLRCLR